MLNTRPNPSGQAHASAALPGAAGAAWPNRGLALAAAAAGLILIPAIFHDATITMVMTWMNSSTFNHGPMIPALAAYLAWRRREWLADLELRFEWAGLVLLILALTVWLLGRLSATMVVQQFGLVFTLQAFVFCVLGRHVVYAFLFPLFYLIFAVPFGAELVPPLQDVTAFFVVSLLRLVGIPVYIDGVFISTPAGHYLVAEACAGLRYLISTVALCLVFANLTFYGWKRRWTFFALSLIVPIIANGVRAFLIVLIAYLSNNEIATGIDHVIYGWVFFSFVTFMLFGIGYAMREPWDEPERVRPAHVPPTGAAPAAAAVAAVIVALGLSLYADRATARTASLDPAVGAPDVPGFTKIQTPNDEWLPRFTGADRQVDQLYAKSGREVSLHVGLYDRERQGAKAVTVEHDFIPGDRWKLGQRQATTVDVDGRRITLVSQRLSAAGRYRLIWYWYWVGGEFTGSPYAAKWLQTKALLTGGNPAAAIVAVSSEYPPALGEPAALFRDMVAAMPVIRTMLEKASRAPRGAQ
jgi:exosortase A